MYPLPTESPDLGTRPPRTHYIPSGFLSSGFLMKKWDGVGRGDRTHRELANRLYMYEENKSITQS